MSNSSLAALRRLVLEAAPRAFVPYSRRPAAAVLLLTDGTWVPGVRVESASFSLTIPAIVNAFSTALAAGRQDVVAAVLDHDARPEEIAFLATLPTTPLEQTASDAFVRTGAGSLPDVRTPLDPFLGDPRPATPKAGVALARQVAARAFVPESDFPVGCVLEVEGGLVPGINVEHTDWSRILCAERNAIGTAISYGLGAARTLYLTCLKDDRGTPCGACRQLLVELTPDARLWMDRGNEPPADARPGTLLPGAFDGRALGQPVAETS